MQRTVRVASTGRATSHSVTSVPRLSMLRGAVFQIGSTRLTGAVRAAIHGRALFQAMADDWNIAMGAAWSHRANRTFEAVEGVGAAALGELEGLVIIVSAGITTCHGSLLCTVRMLEGAADAGCARQRVTVSRFGIVLFTFANDQGGVVLGFEQAAFDPLRVRVAVKLSGTVVFVTLRALRFLSVGFFQPLLGVARNIAL